MLPADLGAPDGLLAEQYFEASTTDRSAENKDLAAAGDWLDCGSGADGVPRPGDGPPARPAWQADLLRRQVAQDVIAHSKQAGNVPGGLLRWAEEILNPKVNWRKVLAAELRRAVAEISGAVDYSYRRPSRRAAVAGNVVLPALRRPVPDVAVVCDTSGSMTEDLLAAALAEVEGLMRALGMARQVRVLACDTAAGAAQRVSSARQVELVGGGGTDMGTGIAAAAALRPRPAITVVLTDGYTPWPAAAPKGTRVVIGLLGPRGTGRSGVGPGRPGGPGLTYRAMNTRPRQQILTVIAIALTFASGAADVASFTRLGGVFTSVMTGNIVLWGLAAARGSLTLASHTAVSIAGYIAGVAGGAWIAHGVKAAPAVRGTASASASADDEGALPGSVLWVLLAQLTLLAGFTVGWEVTGASPAGWAQFGLLATLAAAMGMQSSAVNNMGLTEVSTTYLTGTLTGLVSSLASPGQDTPHGLRRFGVLIGLVAGASLCGLLVATAADGVPALPLAALVTTIAAATRLGWRPPPRRVEEER